MLLFRYLATSRMFTRVLSECWRPLHLVFGEYYFLIASKFGADRRVMGIALADEPLQEWSGFFCLHRTIYTLGAPWIKSAAAELGQLCICTSNPCIASA